MSDARNAARTKRRASWIAMFVLMLCDLRDVPVDDVVHELERFLESTTLATALDREATS